MGVLTDNLPVLAVALPLLGGFAIPLIGILARRVKALKIVDYFALLVGAATFLIIILMTKPILVDGRIMSCQLAGRVPPWGINLAVDGLSLVAGLTAAGLTMLVIIYSIGSMDGKDSLERYYLLLLIMCAGMIGIAFTGDIFNMYVFFEVMSITSYALVAFYRSGPSLEGSFKYLVMGTVGTVCILLGVALVYGLVGTLNIADLSVRLSAVREVVGGFPLPMTMALGFFVTGFGIKIGMVPLHAWLPDAYQAAPTSITALLAGATTIVGVAALLRVSYMLFNALPLGYMFVAVGLVTMVVGAFMALVQDDLKRLLAYSGISQMGYVLLGLGLGGLGTALGAKGGLFHMLNNALYKPLLFLCVGAVAYRAGTSRMDELGGLASRMPVTATTFMIGALAIAGVPPLNGFASKWTIYVAGLQAGHPLLTVIAVVFSALTLAYMLKAFSMVFLGPVPEQFEGTREVPYTLLIPMIVLVVVCIVFGIFPKLGLDAIGPAWETLSNHIPYVEEVLGGAIAP